MDKGFSLFDQNYFKPIHETNFHLAGIIPCSHKPLDFRMPYHDCLVPVAKDFTALERSVMECAYAGCETIWIVLDADVQPIVKYRVGEWVIDPVSIDRPRGLSEKQKRIPIFYVEREADDRKRCFGLSILRAAEVAQQTSYTLSKWVMPDKFYVAFPYGICDPKETRQHRSTISSKKPFYFIRGGTSFLDGVLMSFAFNLKLARHKKEEILKTIKQNQKISKKKEDFTKHFSLDALFKDVIMGEEGVELNWFYEIGTWEGYSKYIGSEEAKSITRPPKSIMDYGRLWRPMGEGLDEVWRTTPPPKNKENVPCSSL